MKEINGKIDETLKYRSKYTIQLEKEKEKKLILVNE